VDPNSDAIGDDDARVIPTLSRWGTCRRPETDDAKFAAISEDGLVIPILTEQDFSCQQWQSK
jgi:hypothetical protein